MDSTRTRVTVVAAAVAAMFCVVLGRLFFVQVLSASTYASQSRKQSQQRSIVAATRGSIFDAQGRVLAQSIQKQMNPTPDISAFVTSGQQRTTPAHAVTRIYPYGELAGTLLGYTGRDGQGLGGIEFLFDRELCGENGWAILQRDGRNFRYGKIGLPRKEPQNGCDVYLTTDIEIQKVVQKVLVETIARHGARGGMCMVMDPATGRILAMADEPSFNPNIPSDYPMDRRTNRCVNSVYEPGSTYKVITAASILQEGAKKETDVVDGSGGVYQVYDQVIRDTKPYGKLTFTQALSHSSNVCFAKLARELPAQTQYRYAKDFGFGSRSGVELPGEETGQVKPVSAWSGRTQVTMAIGQEISVTFLQMMLAFSAVANGGVLVEPQICENVVEPNGVSRQIDQYHPVRRVISESVALRLRHMMQTVVDSGTGHGAWMSGIPIAGKTGTAQKIDTSTGAYSMTRYWSSFIGFVPVENPVLVCGVVIDEPAAGESGGMAAAPAFKQIVSETISNPGIVYGERILLACRESQRTARELAAAADSAKGAGRSGSEVVRTAAHASSRDSVAARPDEAPPAAGATFVNVPRVTDLDARDAVGRIVRFGLTPYVRGLGTVRSQSPLAGFRTHRADVCTLFCAIEG